MLRKRKTTERAIEYARIHRKEKSLYLQAYRKKIKQQVLSHYGNGKFACVRCGENRMPCLTIDHINGGGNQDRQKRGLGGNILYRWLKKHGYPEGYQTLCMNCQFVKQDENDEHYHNGDTEERMMQSYQILAEEQERLMQQSLPLQEWREFRVS